MSNITKTYDHALLLCDGVTSISASAAALVDGSAKIIDLGAGLVQGDIIFDVTEIDVDSNNEIVTMGVQVSDSATFASGIYQLASIQVGDATPLAGDADMTTGRYVVPFNNLIKDNATKRYLRIYWTIAGTVAGFTASAYLAKK